MKKSIKKKTILISLLFITTLGFSQEEKRINSFRMDYMHHHFWQPNYTMTPQDETFVFNTESHLFKDEFIPKNTNIDFSLSYGLWVMEKKHI